MTDWEQRAEQAEADHDSVARAYDERYAELIAARARIAALEADAATAKRDRIVEYDVAREKWMRKKLADIRSRVRGK